MARWFRRLGERRARKSASSSDSVGRKTRASVAEQQLRLLAGKRIGEGPAMCPYGPEVDAMARWPSGDESPHHRPADGPPPPGGEDR
jgi:hypothetical protein